MVVVSLVAEGVAELEPQALMELPVRLAMAVIQRYKALHKVTALEVVADKVAQMIP